MNDPIARVAFLGGKQGVAREEVGGNGGLRGGNSGVTRGAGTSNPAITSVKVPSVRKKGREMGVRGRAP